MIFSYTNRTMVKQKTQKAKHHTYDATFKGVMEWANSELAHVGRIVSLSDKDVQYSYALSTVNGMMHLNQAVEELLADRAYCRHRNDLRKLHGKVERTIDHLIKDFGVNVGTIRAFNTRKVLRKLHTAGTRRKAVLFA